MKFSFKHIILLIGFLASAIQCKKKTNWYENYRERVKSPFGTYIIHKEVEVLFKDADINYLKKNVYDYLTDNYIEGDSNYANYICIKNNASKIKQKELNTLLEFVKNGNNAFLVLNYFSEELKETLGFEISEADDNPFPSNIELRNLDGKLSLKDNSFKKNEFYYDRNLRKNYFSKFSSNTTVLGTQRIYGKDQPVFIKIDYGYGTVFLHCKPIAFTNYYLLKKPNYQYVENVFSYLPNKPAVLWDPLVKYSKKSNNKDDDKTSIFRFFLKHPSLKWSLLVGFAGL